MYIIMRTDRHGPIGYVAPSGSKSSYTSAPHLARRFETKEEAERHRCPGNERIVKLADALGLSYAG